MENEKNQAGCSRRKRPRKPSLAVVSYTPKLHRFYLEPGTFREICRTLGLNKDFGHPEIEVFYEFSEDEYSHSLLYAIFERISNGKRYAAGDKDTFFLSYEKKKCAVEFHEFQDSQGKYLRAVIVGLDAAYQAMPSGDAAALVISLYGSQNL